MVTRKFFCLSPNSKHKTFGERFNFVKFKAVKTNRLVDYINNICVGYNSMNVVRNLKDVGISVSNNIVLRIIKKLT